MEDVTVESEEEVEVECKLVCDISLFMAFKGVEDSLLTPTFSGSTDEH